MEDHEFPSHMGELTNDERLRQLEVSLEGCWALLGQRRALTEGCYNPDEAKVRDEKTVEGCLQ